MPRPKPYGARTQPPTGTETGIHDAFFPDLPQAPDAKRNARGYWGKIEFNLDLVERLASIFCTHREIAAFFNCDKQTITNRINNDQEFRAALERGYDKGRISLRRKQMEVAMEGNPALLIFLGKQFLNQRDTPDVAADDAPKALIPDWLLTHWKQQLGSIDHSPASSDSTAAQPSTAVIVAPSVRESPTH